MATEGSKTAAPAVPAAGRKNIPVRLMPGGTGEIPVLANVVRLQPTSVGVLLDIGFLDPAGVEALSRSARAGGKLPESLNGRLAGRFALTPEAVASLQQQLTGAVNALNATQRPKPGA